MLELMIGITPIDVDEFRSLIGKVLDDLDISEEAIPYETFTKLCEQVFEELLELQK